MMNRIAIALFAALLFFFAVPAVTFAQSERAEAEQDMYDDAHDMLDEHEWRDAAAAFARVAAMKLEHADAALYWQAYAQNKMSQRTEALTTLGTLQKNHPKSKWAQDAKALEVEIRQSAGQRIEPDKVDDEELKLIAVNGLMHTDPERALPILEKIIAGASYTPKVKERALFVLSQSGSPKASEILGRTARGAANPDLQLKAIRYLGLHGGDSNRRVLAEVYQASSDPDVKRSILKSYMIAGDRARLLTLAKGEASAELRAEAVSQLGVMGAKNELAELYATEQSVDVRRSIIKAMFIGGASDKLVEIARSEKVVDLRLTAIKNLGLLGGAKSSQALVAIYETDANPEVRRAVLKGLFLQSNSAALISLARKEKDPEMKKTIIKNLSLIGDKESTEFLFEYLQ